MDLVEQLRAFGLSLPGAHRKSPWPDHDDLAVKDKTFAYLPGKGKPFSLSCKLPYTGYEALQLPFAEPTGYGLGKSGWVSFSPPADHIPSFNQLKEWVEESYRAQAPRKLVKELDARDDG
ncbi:MmcQ/YjbR family DNA-binding protein [Sphingomonas alba]|uniref:MmcQ/YjbR family DNA-binding protein n=1 Tax=Sphingomonas alba TaxID=2908208 RepID=A0ABT0RNY1_9SPHN|nr:MmcQ/YjbR family DNA-binding protein [Sphingomonas alba]MCL6684364.1 MmcQ/YjbR family DNA-binding protein [Sphingomonas alba]